VQIVVKLLRGDGNDVFFNMLACSRRERFVFSAAARAQRRWNASETA
jgi:hypothetical protein